MQSSYSHLRCVITLLACFGAAIGNAWAEETDPDGRLFHPSIDSLADVRQAVGRAKESGRRALVVLGANWCHDSRALAARLHRSPLAEVIQEHYELVLVDVGFYEHGRDVVQQFGVAHYYATPTVLIVDPSTGQLVDDEDRHMWGNAYKIDMSESVGYFEKWATGDPIADHAEDFAALRQLYAEIEKFEEQQADRVAAGYAVVGPMLEAYKAGKAPADFDARWDELSGFRNAIPGDIRELKDEAQRRVSQGDTDIQVQYPAYPPLSWESE